MDQVTKLQAIAPLHGQYPSEALASQPSSQTLLFALGLSPLTARLYAHPGASPSWLELERTPIANAGLMLGLGEHSSPALCLVVFYAGSLLTLGIAAAAFGCLQPKHWLVQLGLCLLMSGVAGNLVDRLRLGYVIDWLCIQWSLGGWEVHLPAFNAADGWIVLGLGCLGLAAAHAWWRKRRALHGLVLSEDR